MKSLRIPVLVAVTIVASGCASTSPELKPVPSGFGSIDPDRRGRLPAPELLKAPHSDGLQFHISTKFIESPSRIAEGHKVMTKGAAERLVLKLNAAKGVDLLSAPSVVTRPGQKAKVEVIQELSLKATAYNKTVPIGVTLDVLPNRLQDGRLHLSGTAAIRKTGSSSTSFNDEKKDNHAFAIQSSKNYFSTPLNNEETALIICRDIDSDNVRQLIALITVELMDPAGRFVSDN